MDQERRPAKRDGGRTFKKGRGGGRFVNSRDRVPSNSTAAEDLAEYVITVLADPDAVQITRQLGSQGRSRLSVNCDPAVTGRLIGKEGRTITALRQLVRAVAGRHGKRVDIEVALQNE